MSAYHSTSANPLLYKRHQSLAIALPENISKEEERSTRIDSFHLYDARRVEYAKRYAWCRLLCLYGIEFWRETVLAIFVSSFNVLFLRPLAMLHLSTVKLVFWSMQVSDTCSRFHSLPSLVIVTLLQKSQMTKKLSHISKYFVKSANWWKSCASWWKSNDCWRKSNDCWRKCH